MTPFEQHIDDCIASEVGLAQALQRDGFGAYTVPWVASKHKAWQAGRESALLESDAQPKQVTCQIYGHVVGACVECNMETEAQQVAVPMTEAQIFACDPVPHVMFDQHRIDFARAIEAFHGIGAKP